MPVASLNRRERLVIAVGTAIVAAAVIARFVALPLATRWTAREELISSSAETIARMRDLIRQEATLRARLSSREGFAGGRRLVTGRTSALAGSALQVALQSYADRSRVTINRLDLAGSPDSAVSTSLPTLPVTISAVGDVYGLSEFLSLVEYGSPVLEIRQLTVVSNSSLRGGLLQMSFQLDAPAVIE